MPTPEESFQPQSLEDIDHWLAFVNPLSTAYDRVEGQLEVLNRTDFRSKLEIIEPASEEDLQSAQARLLGRVSLGSGILVFSGDGGMNHIVNGVMKAEELQDIKVPIFSGGSGNGNDIAHVHTGKPGRVPLTYILRHGDITPVHPIESTIRKEGQPYTRYAVAYMGFGGTAKGAALFDDKLHRENPLYAYRATRTVMEAGLVARTIVEAEAYTVKTHDGRSHVFSELSIANYPREAKYGRWPIAALEPNLFISGIEHKTVGRTIEWLGRLASGSIPGLRYVVDLQPQGRYLEGSATFGFSPSKDLPVHWDAEHAILPAGSHITIGRSSRPFYAVTTQL